MTVSIVGPCSGLIAKELVVPERLQVSSEGQRFAAATQLEKLHSMNQLERKSLQFLATRLSAMQQCLNAFTEHHADLWKEQEEQLSDLETLEQNLQQMREPYMTDLDIELLLSMPQGYQKMSKILLVAEQRWRNARDEVIAQWAEFTSLRQKLGECRRIEQDFKEFQLVRKEQQKLWRESAGCSLVICAGIYIYII